MNRENALRILALSLVVAGASDAARGQVLNTVPVSGDTQANLPDSSPVAPPPEVKFNLPEVNCNNGQLTIRADSSNIRSVLQALRTCLGIAIEVPATLTDEPLFVELGPGPVNSILSDFLGLTDLNYVVVSSEGVPSTILKIEFSPTSSETEAIATTATQATDQMSPARRAWLAERNLGRGLPPQDVESGTTTNRPIFRQPEESPSPQEPTTSLASTAQTANPTSTTSVEVAAATPATSDANQSSAADNGLRNQITDMQRLFEERKKLNQQQQDPKAGSAPSAGPDTSITPPSQ